MPDVLLHLRCIFCRPLWRLASAASGDYPPRFATPGWVWRRLHGASSPILLPSICPWTFDAATASEPWLGAYRMFYAPLRSPVIIGCRDSMCVGCATPLRVTTWSSLPTSLVARRLCYVSLCSHVDAGCCGSLHNYDRYFLCVSSDGACLTAPSAPLRSQQRGHAYASLTQDASALVLPTLGYSRPVSGSYVDISWQSNSPSWAGPCGRLPCTLTQLLRFFFQPMPL
ncbi:hypothetical protein V6N13_001675 [Hibiscus sabdariffa]|uniref:Uncharacterized protein n=1 Tax=Hibiscus sabdariffa TaxID=183260 RepID=A0ABR2G934_9ROSI